MNHHLPPLPHGQPAVPPPRRQPDIPYTSAPPNARSSQGYMGYHHPHAHAAGPPPPYQYQQHWYPYQQMPHPPPPQPYQSYSPLIVSSYPRSQHTSVTVPPPSFPPQAATTSSTPQHSSFSLTPPPPSVPASITQQDVSTIQLGETQHKEVDKPSTTSVAPLAPSAIPLQVSANERSKVQAAAREPFRPPLPWLSVPEAPFPEKFPRRRRRPRIAANQAVALSFKADNEENEHQKAAAETESSLAERSTPPTPTTSQLPSERSSTQPTTPSSATNPLTPTHARQSSHINVSRPVVPVVPIVPILPTSPSAVKQGQSTIGKTGETAKLGESKTTNGSIRPVESKPEDRKETTPPRPQPKSWADLVRSKHPTTASINSVPSSGVGTLATSKSESLIDVINNLASEGKVYNNKTTFIEPRGLVNTGNMCYMNSILQVLVFCIPFYDFLDRISRRASHSFKSELPLLDAMIMFMREFRVIDSANSIEQLRLRLKQNEVEQYGTSFIPEYVYQVIRNLPRFRDMRRGHQQDAQEFLGFLFEELHEECLQAARSSASPSDVTSTAGSDAVSMTDDSAAEGWLEVGHKQKPAVTRSSGHIVAESPITRIFGGKIRSEFRVPGNKNSVTLEPYQSLQLDIGSPQVNNIIDALKGLTRPETMHGDFSSSRGTKVNATKQVFIESLPPVLILHLKRFHYDSATKGTQKIWKKIGYPLELEIPKEVFPPHRRNLLVAQGGGLPKYRLTGVIYHHGKIASGGHYTVEIRRQDGREWIRIDDTVIRRVRSEDVASAGSDEGPKALATALEQQQVSENGSQSNIFRHFDQDDDQDNDRGWNQVNGSGAGHASKKSTSALANGTISPGLASADSSGKRTPSSRLAVRENKVAYLLFYQRA
ncbi:ubiquitin carboxyl-terminal hydrolase [Emydomyces testavorans]|uniref:Ubiquitin carboxyl-terminal hydrolase n=1 Tax=Emydomyces testavorans TaxID=2070801 RepID=A0AAF0IQF7_9EURO|nr:ubiquitin carboxyl-terminal hydrolase [Emydomyces testavorans]